MRIHQLLRIGEHHINHCEDYTVMESLGQNRVLCAVMDGCTMGTDSYFAATLVGKLLRKLAIEKSYQSFYEKRQPSTVEVDSKEILRGLMAELKRLKSQLLLNDDELLTTLLLMIVNTESKQGQIVVVGDGLVCINGQFTEYEQDNRPDYLGYHLGEDFEAWYGKQTQILRFDTIMDVSIATDGIFTFAKYDKQVYNQQKDPIEYLLTDAQDADLDHMLNKKFLFLEQQCGLKPTDDLGIIRLIQG
jgi:hypothetical protein